MSLVIPSKIQRLEMQEGDLGGIKGRIPQIVYLTLRMTQAKISWICAEYLRRRSGDERDWNKAADATLKRTCQSEAGKQHSDQIPGNNASESGFEVANICRYTSCSWPVE